ncbi:MAG: double zinc ribbon domain-containing protein [Luteimonas sp.]
MSTAVNQIAAGKVDGLRRRLGFWLRNDAARLLWPGRCLACSEDAGEAIDLCPTCLDGLPWLGPACSHCALPLPGVQRPGASACGACLANPPPLAEVHAACLYAAPLDRLLPRFKFHHDLAAGRLLAQLMAEHCAALPKPDALVPIPLHRARLRQRGYDQALELARPLAGVLDIALRPELLRRVRATAQQSRLDAAARARNLRRAFQARIPAEAPAHVVLIDDVMTTGATLHAAAHALRSAGVQRVDAWVCARAP